VPARPRCHARYETIMADAQKKAACIQFERELPACLEGELLPFVPAHARECPGCAALWSDLVWMRAAVKELPPAEPSPVVWAGLRARLEAEGVFHSPTRGWRFILAWPLRPQAVPLAVIGLLVALGVPLTLPRPVLRPAPGPIATESLFPSAPDLVTAEDRVLASLGKELETSFRAREVSMTPELKATYEKSLLSLDGSIRECLESIAAQPANTLARDYLLAAYTSKAEVLSSALEFEGR